MVLRAGLSSAVRRVDEARLSWRKGTTGCGPPLLAALDVHPRVAMQIPRHSRISVTVGKTPRRRARHRMAEAAQASADSRNAHRLSDSQQIVRQFGRSGKQLQRRDVSWGDGAEMTLVERGDLSGAEPFGGGDHRRVSHAEGKAHVQPEHRSDAGRLPRVPQPG